MKFLVTGCSGFIGFHVVNKLLQMGYSVTGIDSITDYYDQDLKLNRTRILEDKGLDFYKIDISEVSSLNDNFDFVLHFAAQPGVRVPKEKEDTYIHTNIHGFKNVYDFCKQKNIKYFIYASSSSVYGDDGNESFSEGITHTQPKSIYGLTKLFNEKLVDLDKENSTLSSIGLRFFSVYGPWGRPDMAYFKFADQISKSKTVTLFNGGKMKRDMTYISDIVDGIMCSISYIQKKECKNEIFNLGNNKPIKTNKMLEEIQDLLNKRTNIRNEDSFLESEITHANTSKSRRELGYEPKIDYKTGLKQFIDWYNEYYKK